MSRSEKVNSGVVLVSVLALILCACIVMFVLTIHSGRSMLLTRRTLEFQRAFVASESALGYGVMSVREELFGNKRALFPSKYKTLQKFDITDKIPADEFTTKYSVVIDNRRVADGNNVETFDVVVRAASVDRQTGIASALQQRLAVKYSSLGDYAAFYDGDLEAQPGATMKFVGKVHSNGDIYVGGSLQFDRNISCVGDFFCRRKNGGKERNGTSVKIRLGDDADYSSSSSKSGNALRNTYNTSYAANRSYLDSDMIDNNGYAHPDEWTTISDLYYEGAVKTGENGITTIKPPISVDDDNHTIIERPLPSTADSYKADTEASKFSNKAAVTIHVDSTGNMTVKNYNGESLDCLREARISTASNNKNSSTGAYLYDMTIGADGKSGDGEYQTDNTFWDVREQKAMAPVDIYLDNLLKNSEFVSNLFPTDLPEGSIVQGGVIYITRDESAGRTVSKEMTRGTGVYEATGGYDEYKTTDWSTAQRYIQNGYTHYQSGYVGRRYYYFLRRPQYAEVMETYTETATVPLQSCVRIRNASNLSSVASKGGLSIVTDNPVYVDGVFNTDGGSGYDGQTPSSDALLAGDGVTMLSKNWKDSWAPVNFDGYILNGKDALDDNVLGMTARDPADTTFNGIIMTGIVPTIEKTNNDEGVYSGGLENVFRFMEDWSDFTYIFNGSIICMWDSEVADAPWRGTDTDKFNKASGTGGVYNAPNRTWGYTKMTPPGIPQLFSVAAKQWERIDFNADEWN